MFVVIGTRPEAIKLAPVVKAIRDEGRMAVKLIATSQHRELLRQALDPFALVPDVDLDVMTAGQSLTHVATAVLSRLEPLLKENRPDWVVVQGDTTTAFAAAVAAFYAGVPVAHVEAGLRSGQLTTPFPEEFNRRAVTVATTLHLAPTSRAVANLRSEGVPEAAIRLVGNTVVDAVLHIRQGRSEVDSADQQLILVTLHRRESFGEPIVRVLKALRQLASEHCGHVKIVYPVHPNPSVNGPAREYLAGVPGVELLPPMDYPPFLELFSRARFVMSDSGGVQEEAPTLGVPVLILRESTERPEVVESGWGKLVGTDSALIVREATNLLRNDQARADMTRQANPFGDGFAARRIAAALCERSQDVMVRRM